MRHCQVKVVCNISLFFPRTVKCHFSSIDLHFSSIDLHFSSIDLHKLLGCNQLANQLDDHIVYVNVIGASIMKSMSTISCTVCIMNK